MTRLTEQWQAEQRQFGQRDLSGVDYVYRWSDGIHVNTRADHHPSDRRVSMDLYDGQPDRLAHSSERLYPGQLPVLLDGFVDGEQINGPFELWS